MTKMVKAAFICDSPKNIDYVYAKGRRERLAEIVDLYDVVIESRNFHEHAKCLEQLEVIFSTWGMPKLSKEQLNMLPNLKAVFYAAGSVKGFAVPLLERGITVVSAWAANAIPVAEFTLAQILLACKGYFKNIIDSKNPAVRIGGKPFTGKGNFGETISLLGAGKIGRKLIELLKNFELEVQVYDPYLSEEEARSLGVKKVSLEEAFATGYVVSNHVPNTPETMGMLNRRLFEMMRQDATFINTGRGATVVEEDLIATLKKRPDIVALLDVTWPEPPVETSEFYKLPNVYLTSHIAGSLGDEVVRMADYCIEEFLAWKEGRPLKYAVNLEMLETMA